MPLEIEIVGLENATAIGNSLENVRRKFMDRLFALSDDFGNDAVGTAKRDYLSGPRPERLGVVTGFLRSSVAHKTKVEDDTVSVVIGSHMFYAPYHEFGTHRMQARPFLRPAVTDNLAALERNLKSLMADVVTNASRPK